MKIAVVGCGYVGLSLAVLLAQNNQVTLLDIIPDKILMVNNKKSPIRDNEISKFLDSEEFLFNGGIILNAIPSI